MFFVLHKMHFVTVCRALCSRVSLSFVSQDAIEEEKSVRKI